MKKPGGYFTWRASVAMSVCLGAWLAAPAQALEDSDCLICHGDPSANVERADGSVRSLYVDEEMYKATVHGDAGCVSCHFEIDELPHLPELEPVACGICHVEVEEYEKSLHGQHLLMGDADINGCSDCHGTHEIRKSSDPLSMTHARNMPQTCGVCHSDPALARRHMISVVNPSDSYMKSEHAQQIGAGNLDAASCTDCHGTHDLLPAFDPASKVYRRNIAETCGACHPEPLAQWKESIHGIAFAAGIRDAPTCNDCHGEHEIIAPENADSRVAARNMVTDTCTHCHDDEKVMSKYGIATARQASYMDSYHGLAGAAGSNVVASCASCHEHHLILPPYDPASTVYPANLPETCGKCHENAGPNFAVGVVHIMPTDPDQRALGLVRLVYIILIASIVGFMVVHNTLSMGRRAMGKFRSELGGRNTYRRFTRAMTIGHLVLTIAFTALALSGFALRYPEAWWAQIIFPGETGLAARGIVHRAAGVILIAVSLLNAWFLLFTKGGRRELGYLRVKFRDARDLLHNVGYMLGLRKTRPKFDRYNYMEKFEYWGMWWGTLLMIITGFCMWFVNIFLQHFPKIALDVVALIHFYEAWLAVLTIVVWHLYYMIFDPETYPMNWSWVTGHITLEDLVERHPIEYEREVAGKDHGGQAPTPKHLE
jgi:cytochrome b subunit of formate dehydrogenase